MNRFAIKSPDGFRIDTLTALLPNVSFSLGFENDADDQFLEDHEVFRVVDTLDFEPNTQELEGLQQPKMVAGKLHTVRVRTLTKPQINARLQAAITEARKQVDGDSDYLANQVMGARQFEYATAFAQARIYLDAVGAGNAEFPVPEYVELAVGAAEAAGRELSPQQAAREIIQQYERASALTANIRGNRLSFKEMLQAAPTLTRVHELMEEWKVTYANTQGALT